MAKTIYFQIFLGLFALSLSVVYPRVKNLIAMAGFSRKDWTPKNLESCQSVHADKFIGCEDMHLHVDGDVRTMFLACTTDMQHRIDWCPAMGHVSKPEIGIKDRLYAWDLVKDEVTELDTGAWTSDFVSHGFDVVPTKNAREVAIYAINHLTTGSVIEKFIHKLGSSTVNHVRTIEDQLIVTTPNDIYVADETDDFFYTTNDHKFKTGLLRELETMLQFPTTHLAVHSNTQGGYKIAQGGLQNINGLAGDRNGRFFVNHVNGYVSVYDHGPQGDIKLVQKVKLGHASDNPSYSAETGELLVSGFPRALELADFAKHPHETPAASIVTRINVSHLGSKFFGDGPGNVVQPPLDEFFLDPGTGVANMTTTTVVDKVGDAFYLTGLFGYAVVKCTGYGNTYESSAAL